MDGPDADDMIKMGLDGAGVAGGLLIIQCDLYEAGDEYAKGGHQSKGPLQSGDPRDRADQRGYDQESEIPDRRNGGDG